MCAVWGRYQLVDSSTWKQRSNCADFLPVVTLFFFFVWISQIPYWSYSVLKTVRKRNLLSNSRRGKRPVCAPCLIFFYAFFPALDFLAIGLVRSLKMYKLTKTFRFPSRRVPPTAYDQPPCDYCVLFFTVGSHLMSWHYLQSFRYCRYVIKTVHDLSVSHFFLKMFYVRLTVCIIYHEYRNVIMLSG